MGLVDLLEKEKKDILERRKEGIFRHLNCPYKNIFLLFFGVVNIALGLVALMTFIFLNEVSIPYSTGINNKTLNIKKSAEYKMYVQVGQFNQNYLYYSKSISTKQLKGEATFDLSKCKPIISNGNRVYYPCGLIANSFLQDIFTITGKEISTKNISWSSEVKKVKPTKYSLNQILAPPLWKPYKEVPNLQGNERFVNWISLAPFNTFRKLYGKVYLEKGVYNFTINSDYPYGNKSVVFAETSWIGVKNYFLAILCICTGILMIGGFYLLYDHNNNSFLEYD